MTGFARLLALAAVLTLLLIGWGLLGLGPFRDLPADGGPLPIPREGPNPGPAVVMAEPAPAREPIPKVAPPAAAATPQPPPKAAAPAPAAPAPAAPPARRTPAPTEALPEIPDTSLAVPDSTYTPPEDEAPGP